MNRYPKDWPDIALAVKKEANWICAKCGQQCLKPGDDTKHLTKSERMRLTLVVHHFNYTPEDNRVDNLISVCTACHLEYHARKRGNVAIGQLKLF
jgi:5-methylcytosine-specific restriction endonuclease McrA